MSKWQVALLLTLLIPMAARAQEAEECIFGEEASWCDAENAGRFEMGVALYVGTKPGCNAGIVTSDPSFRGCSTRPIGFSISDNRLSEDSNAVGLFVGIVPNVNAGYVTNSQAHRGGATRAIGILSRAPFKNGVRLYVGTAIRCNAGEVSITPGHKGCDTKDLGYALPVAE